KAGKLAMHLAPRADPLHDLLANVTAFVEVERLGLAGLLGQITVPDVLAVLWNSLNHAPPFQGLRSYHRPNLPDAYSRCRLVSAHRHPQFVPARLVHRPADQQLVCGEFADFE